ncbi:hypothetical protein Bhyg_12231 [Pseudolycoriella hygida]|uniref:DDE Tnp4 domain-containing protein n=1 Tax=Pseudolycoriella hygida TaxID=35572 RepID=A0A9Q0MYI2_9DIPT|nr:hypothetical protein Bhyg_12231 [Pseudolycoriella hygida]
MQDGSSNPMPYDMGRCVPLVTQCCDDTENSFSSLDSKESTVYLEEYLDLQIGSREESLGENSIFNIDIYPESENVENFPPCEVDVSTNSVISYEMLQVIEIPQENVQVNIEDVDAKWKELESLRNENERLKLAVKKLERQVDSQSMNHQNSHFDFEHIAHSDEKFMNEIPDKTHNLKSMPNVFKEFTDCRIILDCTEMFTDKPNRMDRQKEFYSSYKHHVTVKPLVGIAPNGVITYSSGLYLGSMSDKKIVQHCGIINKLHSGDLILADKGFVIRDILPNDVHLNVPPFLTSLQFTRQQVLETERIARARVHVERCMNRIKNFRLVRYIPAELFNLSTPIFQVCVALTNFQYPIIREVADRL